jgi:hypothetical protein
MGALLVGVFIFGYMKGSAYADAELARFGQKNAELVADLEKKNTEISTQVVTEYVDRVQVIKEKEYVYRDVAKTVVPSQSVLSNGWVFTHDISATGSDADATRSSDASPSGIKDNEALVGIIGNYSRCQQNAQQLIALQKWITDNKAAIEELNKKAKK